MSMLSYWENDYNHALKIENNICELLEDKTLKSSLSSERSTRAASIRGSLAELLEHIKELELSMYKILSHPQQLNQKHQFQLEENRKKLLRLQKSYEELQIKLKNTTNQVTSTKNTTTDLPLLDNPYQNYFPKYSISTEPKNKTNVEIITDPHELLIDIEGKVSTIKNVSYRINSELQIQNKIIEKNTNDVVATERSLSRTRKLLAWSNNHDGSTWYLIICLISLLAILIIILFVI